MSLTENISVCRTYFAFENKSGCTPAVFAAFDGHTEALALLLANGANVNDADLVPQNLFTISHEFDSKYIRLSRSLCINN
jgi:hypothetical protein